MRNNEDLPTPTPGLRWHAVNGQQIFPVYSRNGGVMASVSAILIKEIYPGFDGDFGAPGLHVVDHGKWFHLMCRPFDDIDAKAQQAIEELSNA